MVAQYAPIRLRRALVAAVAGLVLAGICLTVAAESAVAGTPTGRDSELRTIAILDFKVKNAPPGTARAAADSLAGYLQRTGKFSVPEREAVTKATEKVMSGFYAGRVCDEVACAVSIGIGLRVGSVAIGSITEFGRLLMISVRIVSVYSGTVVEQLTVESVKGQEGMPEAIRELAEEIISSGDQLPDIGRGPYPDELEQARMRRSEQYTTSFAASFGTGLRGHDSEGRFCTATSCTENTAELKWAAHLSFCARLKDSEWIFGLRGGALSVTTSWCAPGDDSPDVCLERAGESGINLYLIPQVGYTVYELNSGSISLLAGLGYRNFTNESHVSKSCAILGLTAGIFVLRADIVYWRGLTADSLLQDLVTISAGLGVGL